MKENQRLLHINFKGDNLQTVLVKMCHDKSFTPVNANKIVDQSKGLRLLEGNNPYHEVLMKMKNIEELLQFVFTKKEIEPEFFRIKDVEQKIDFVSEKAKAIIETKQIIEDVNKDYEKAIQYIKFMEAASFNFDELFLSKYYKVRFGRMPIDNVVKLEHYEFQPFVFKSFGKDMTHVWCVYFTTLEQEGNTDNIFSGLLFERIRVPTFVHGDPKNAIVVMQEEINLNLKQLEIVNDRLQMFTQSDVQNLFDMYQNIELLNDAYVYRKNVVDLSGSYTIVGTIQESFVQQLVEKLDTIAQIDNLPLDSDLRLQLKNKKSWWKKIFRR